MAQEEVTMAEYFKQVGYTTAICGKWHINFLYVFVGDYFPPFNFLGDIKEVIIDNK